MTTWTLSRWSREWVGPIAVEADGDPVTDWTYAVLPSGDQPASAEAIDGGPDPLGGGLGILVGPGTANALSRGTFAIWVRYEASPEAPVLDDVGTLVVT